MEDNGRPVSVMASASKGVASNLLGIDCEDTITLTVQWECFDNSSHTETNQQMKYTGNFLNIYTIYILMCSSIQQTIQLYD